MTEDWKRRYDPRDGLIRIIRELALEIKPPGEFFTLKSGKKSRIYLDCRKLTLHSEGLLLACREIEYLLFHTDSNGLWIDTRIGGQRIDAVGGPCVGADPLVGGLLARYAHSVSGLCGPIRGFLVRKEEKDHGKAGRIIGSIQPGDSCLLVEDVVTTGQTTLDAVACVEAFGGQVVAVTALVDREEGANEAFAARGIPFFPVLKLSQLGLPTEE